MDGNSVDDDSSIPDDEVLLRRITPDWADLDDSLGTVRPTSQAFQGHRGSGRMSVHIASVLSQLDLAWESVVERMPGYGIVSLTAGEVRAAGLGVRLDPLPEDPSHGVVSGDLKKRSVRKQLREAASWVRMPTQ
jgi:hypothetical protein